MFFRALFLVLVSVIVVSCTCAVPLRVSEIQKTDKELSCKEVILEMNEAEHYRNLASKQTSIGMHNMLMPVCWITDYVDGGRARKAANARLEYLGGIYDVLDCGGRGSPISAPKKQRPVPPVVQPSLSIQPEPSNRRRRPEVQYQERPAEYQNPFTTQQAPTSPNKAVDYIHQHINGNGDVYTHSHFYVTPHTHSGDQ